MKQDYRFAFFFTREEGAIVGSYTGATATSEWRPTPPRRPTGCAPSPQSAISPSRSWWTAPC